MKPIVSDNILREAVVKEPDSDPEVAAKHISVITIDGAVTLGGHVMRDHEKHVAVRAAERVPTVRAVADDIEVAAQVRDGRVILHGDVGSASQRDAAESAVRQLTGVRDVDNLIRIRHGNG
jgi:osmotically-inducible protein OsmY